MTFLNLIARAIADIGRGLWARITDEPVLTLGLVQAAILLSVGFGLNWTRDQVVLAGAFAAALLAFVARRQVTPA